MNGIYWGLTALCLMNRRDALDRKQMLDWVMSCWDESVGAALVPLAASDTQR
jgi:geranylgeranyl transferase type-2 subunit beta